MFTGLVLEDSVSTEKKSLKAPFDYVIYTDLIVIKDDFGKSYAFDPADTIWLTRDAVFAYIRRCLNGHYYEHFYPVSTNFITLDYDLTDHALWTTESKQASINVYNEGQKMYTDGTAHTTRTNNKFLIESGNILRFNKNQDAARIEVFIEKNFIYS